jgi:S-formylglutathione hydrolase FrmB
VLGATPVGNLYLNVGHGSTGWAMACGSARVVADLMAGDNEETGPTVRGLAQQGDSINLDYAAHADGADAVLYRLPGGQHNQASWARMLPVFLRWAYADGNRHR